MIDALLYSVRDGIRAAGFGYGRAECEIMEDGKPPPRCGNFFVSVHGGKTTPWKGTNDNSLSELYSLTVTLTMRVVVPLDRVGDQQIARNIELVPLGQRSGFNHKVDQLRAYLHMNWERVVLVNQTPGSANDNLSAWATGTVYGFCEPLRWQGTDGPRLVGGEWFGAEPDAEDVGVVADLRLADAKRFQPHTLAVGPFV